MRSFRDFRHIIVEDAEYYPQNGTGRHSPPVPLCFSALDLVTGTEYRLFGADLWRQSEPPWPCGPDSLHVTYNAIAELSGYYALNWGRRIPANILDLLYEFRLQVNGVLHKDAPRGLLNALEHHRLSGIPLLEKDYWREFILSRRGGPYTREERDGILNYNWTDIAATRDLLHAMQPNLPADLDRCLFRTRCAVAATQSELIGIPIDTPSWSRILEHREHVIRAVTKNSPVHDEAGGFRRDRFATYLERLGLLNTWPRTPTKLLSTSGKAFEERSWHASIKRLGEVCALVDQLRSPSFEVFRDRNYYSLLPYKAESGRNSTIGCIFQNSHWWRGLIQPPPGWALIQADYKSEEFLIAGARSGDANMLAAYNAEPDLYMPLAVKAGLAPPGATGESHPMARKIAKRAALSLQYGIGVRRLALNTAFRLIAHEMCETLTVSYTANFGHGQSFKSKKVAGTVTWLPHTIGVCT